MLKFLDNFLYLFFQIKNNEFKKRARVISIDMGYDHQRAAYPLKDITFERIITANSDKIISDKESKIWDNLRRSYEFVSRLKELLFVGKLVFSIYDKFQSISPFFPFRDLSKPNFGVIYFRRLILKKNLCKSLIDYVNYLPILRYLGLISIGSVSLNTFLPFSYNSVK